MGGVMHDLIGRLNARGQGAGGQVAGGQGARRSIRQPKPARS